MYAGRVHCPVLILHGGSDITVPIRSAERIALRSCGRDLVESITVNVWTQLDSVTEMVP